MTEATIAVHYERSGFPKVGGLVIHESELHVSETDAGIWLAQTHDQRWLGEGATLDEAVLDWLRQRVQ